MNFEAYLKEQLKEHPSMQIQDVIKMCYQAANGAEHLLSDTELARAYFKSEYESVEEKNGELYERISDNVCRVNISAWKAEGLPSEWLFRMFEASCKVAQNANAQFAEYLQAAEKLVTSSDDAGFSLREWDEYLSEYKKKGMPAVHHSEEYRKNEKPAYRIVESRFCAMLPILMRAKEYYNAEKPCVIAIDGRAASGKTTLASCLQTVLGADVVHMDDFFVPPELRSEARFKKAGENIHHERFKTEVLPFISMAEPFSYRIFDCSKMDYNGRREIGSKLFRVVEGSYSLHPTFGVYADITVFSDVTSEEQKKRILKRNGEEMLYMFLSRWIPLEEEYFECYSVRGKADIIMKNE